MLKDWDIAKWFLCTIAGDCKCKMVFKYTVCCCCCCSWSKLTKGHISSVESHRSPVVLFSRTKLCVQFPLCVVCVCVCVTYSKIAGRMESRRAIPLLVGRKCVASCSRKPSSTNLSTASQFSTCNVIQHESEKLRKLLCLLPDRSSSINVCPTDLFECFACRMELQRRRWNPLSNPQTVKQQLL